MSINIFEKKWGNDLTENEQKGAKKIEEIENPETTLVHPYEYNHEDEDFKEWEKEQERKKAS